MIYFTITRKFQSAPTYLINALLKKILKRLVDSGIRIPNKNQLLSKYKQM